MSPTVFKESRELLTRSVEDYLKAIYRLSVGGQPVSTSDIAELLGLSAPSVSGMIRRLSEQGMLQHVPYRGVELTAAGRIVALRMLRRHRLLEAYLVGFLGYTWDTVHPEAERLEHAVSDVMIERMAAALGNPQFDPHGDPIPDAEGHIRQLSYTPLSDITPGEAVQIGRVATSDPERLRYLENSGLKPGTSVTVVRKQPFGGPVTIETGTGEQIVGIELASQVLCVRPEAS